MRPCWPNGNCCLQVLNWPTVGQSEHAAVGSLPLLAVWPVRMAKISLVSTDLRTGIRPAMPFGRIMAFGMRGERPGVESSPPGPCNMVPAVVPASLVWTFAAMLFSRATASGVSA